MRRWFAAAALAGALAVLPAGCGGRPDGVDGDLVDDWRPIGEPEPFVPKAGVCGLDAAKQYGNLALYDPLDCGLAHNTETVYVGTFTGADAERAVPPPAGSPPMRAAYADCDKRAKAYLGDDWRTARLYLWMMVPNLSVWPAGGRWFRCELSELSSVEGTGAFIKRTGSLKAALKAASPLKLGCYTVKLARNGDIDVMTPVGCAKAHRAEFVGVYTAPDITYPSGDKHRATLVDGCESVLAKFAKVPDDSLVKYRSGLIWYPAAEGDWKGGDRGVRCYLWMGDRDLKRSMRGAGPAGLPVN